MYSTPAHSANRALSILQIFFFSQLLLSLTLTPRSCLRADHIKQHECRGKILRLGLGSGYRLTTRTCASFCWLNRIHALNHRKDKFLHTRTHSRGAGDDEITRETPNLQTTALSKNKMERTGHSKVFKSALGLVLSMPCSRIRWLFLSWFRHS